MTRISALIEPLKAAVTPIPGAEPEAEQDTATAKASRIASVAVAQGGWLHNAYAGTLREFDGAVGQGEKSRKPGADGEYGGEPSEPDAGTVHDGKSREPSAGTVHDGASYGAGVDAVTELPPVMLPPVDSVEWGEARSFEMPPNRASRLGSGGVLVVALLCIAFVSAALLALPAFIVPEDAKATPIVQFNEDEAAQPEPPLSTSYRVANTTVG